LLHPSERVSRPRQAILLALDLYTEQERAALALTIE
jgi:hypothetical protein